MGKYRSFKQQRYYDQQKQLKSDAKREQNKQIAIEHTRLLYQATDKYLCETGIVLPALGGVVKIAWAISGQRLSKNEAWNYLQMYVEGFIPKIVKREVISKPYISKNKHDFNYYHQNEYSKENARKLYESREWKSIRVHIIEQQKGKCQMCGRSYREHGVVMHVDHIVPLSKDWSRRLDPNNLQLLCSECNEGKGNKYTTDWRK